MEFFTSILGFAFAHSDGERYFATKKSRGQRFHTKNLKSLAKILTVLRLELGIGFVWCVIISILLLEMNVIDVNNRQRKIIIFRILSCNNKVVKLF